MECLSGLLVTLGDTSRHSRFHLLCTAKANCLSSSASDSLLLARLDRKPGGLGWKSAGPEGQGSMSLRSTERESGSTLGVTRKLYGRKD